MDLIEGLSNSRVREMIHELFEESRCCHPELAHALPAELPAIDERLAEPDEVEAVLEELSQYPNWREAAVVADRRDPMDPWRLARAWASRSTAPPGAANAASS